MITFADSAPRYLASVLARIGAAERGETRCVAVCF